MSCNNSIYPTVFIRSVDGHIINEDLSPISWSEQQLNILKGIVKHISPKDHQFSVSFNFTELSKSWQISKDRIYAKIIELYYIRDTSPNQLNVEDSSSKDKQIWFERSSDKDCEKHHPVHELELLKINPINSDHSDTAGLQYKQPFSLGQTPSLDIGSMRTGPLDADNSNSSSSDESNTNMVATSAYLYRSKFIQREIPNQIGQSDNEFEQEINNNDYLLTGTTESLSKSLLEQELLERI
ncbi:hypothetical protein KL905_005331 [Ogataea polymorpha]|uniref:uncharacterized protein n=1 Tax=Ogataea polymorpha TaxID=460523 RepID=UPI0007F48B05|nr:uncharacterized protein OGAPODRAFT_14414 [Ogataea polymorpha]KAG7887736.1 hypothetical protein KL908_005387 [Ogataea polymorpha]KAG7897250.1 hypothetical protein KL935_005321 [Ogataea polymorpha]KAG7898180.1 hypothetical protein KL907_005376 [Ogataea polymorpha]KAG7914565.1 hypothetical protein KL905_005331 [Ogataea polymorpha]KAG7924454.1 hypothetical protein KL925_005404 [Ogataea polymorpha]